MNTFFLGSKSDSADIYFAGPGIMNKPTTRFSRAHKSKLKVVKQFHSYVRNLSKRSGILKLHRISGLTKHNDTVSLQRLTIHDSESLVWAWVTEKMNDNAKPNTIRRYINHLAWYAMVVCGVNSIMNQQSYL